MSRVQHKERGLRHFLHAVQVLPLMMFTMVTISRTVQTMCLLASSAIVVHSKPSTLQDRPESLLAEDTIGHFMLTHPPENYTDELIAQTPNCTDFYYNVDASTLNSTAWSCASSPMLVPRRRRLPSRIPIFPTYSYSATYDDGNGNGYNITYPLQLCSSSVIGDVLSPEGSVVQNATLQSVWTSLAALSPDELYNYTESLLQNAFNKFDIAIDTVLCDPPVGGSRDLLTRYQPSQVSGKTVLALLGVPGVFGVAFGTIYVPVAHPGITANLTGTEDAVLSAASATITTLYFFALQKLHKAEVTNVIEAFIFTVLVTAAEGFIWPFRQAWEGLCTTMLLLKEAVERFQQQTQDEVVVVADPNQAGVELVPQNPQQPPNPPQVQLGNVCG